MKNDGSLTAKDMCDIIKACGAAGVSEFRYGKLTVKVGSYLQPIELDRVDPVKELDSMGKVDAEVMLDQEKDVRQSQLEMSIIEDPEGYEQLLSQGEVNAETNSI